MLRAFVANDAEEQWMIFALGISCGLTTAPDRFDETCDLIVVNSVCLGRCDQGAIWSTALVIQSNAVSPIPFELRLPLPFVFCVAEHSKMFPQPCSPSVGVLDREVGVSSGSVLADKWPLIFIQNPGRGKLVGDDHL